MNNWFKAGFALIFIAAGICAAAFMYGLPILPGGLVALALIAVALICSVIGVFR